MVKVIRLSRYVFDKEHIQHNVTFSVSALFDNEEKMANERIRIMTTLLETLCPNTIKVVSMNKSTRPLTSAELNLKKLNFTKRASPLNEGEEITLDQLGDIMLYCYSECYELELDILDIRDRHVTVVINKDMQRYHYLYGSPETFTNEYLASIKKKLKDCTFDGSFKKTL